MQVAGGLPAMTLAEETTTRDPGAAGKSAANMIADFTWALATGMAYRIP